MGKIITIWGNPGSGKSMFACNLAKVLTAGKKKALIINADSSTPMLPVWMPDRILETSASIGNVLTALEINNALIAERVVVLKEYPFIGVLGYAAGENPFSYPELKYEKIKIFISECAKLVDYILIDCSANMLNFFAPTAMEAADLVVRIITPDLRGLSYFRAHKALLTDSKFKFDEQLTFAMMFLVVGNIPLLYVLNHSWFETLMYSIPGKITLAVCAAIVLFSFTRIMALSKPVEYK